MTIQGEPVKISDYRGGNVLLFFGTSWCDKTEEVIPALNQIDRDFQQSLKVIFIAPRQQPEELLDFAKAHNIICSIVADTTGIVSVKYGINRMPQCVFIDSKGIVQYTGPLVTDTIWRLMAGIKVIPPVSAQSRFKLPKNKSSDPLKNKLRRVIIELDESPSLSKRLDKKTITNRRSQLTAGAKKIGARIIHNYGKWKNKIVLEIDKDKLDLLRSLPRFKSVKDDVKVKALLEDSVYQIKADYAWGNAITGAGILVGVIDTGIDTNHPDLMNVIVNQYDFFNDTPEVVDDNGHGTHVAGIIASQGLTFRGVSFDVGLLGAKVLDMSGNGYSSDVILGIQWCVDNGADVINLSLGEGLFSSTCDDLDMAQAVNEAVDAGVVVVCASGNDGNPNQIVSPACASKAIAVGSVDKNDGIASYSDGGTELDLVAPGGDILGGTNFPEIASTFSTIVANDPYLCMYFAAGQCFDGQFLAGSELYIRAVGTSMAAPHVAGAAALILEYNSSLTPLEVKSVLQDNADDLGDTGWDNIFGWGRINLERALNNIPEKPSELHLTITDPNMVRTFSLGQEFPLNIKVDCLGGNGCGEVTVIAQYSQGVDSNDFVDISPITDLLTIDENPITLGALSGYTFESYLPIIFDLHTMLDISDDITTKQTGMDTSQIGSTLLTDYNTGDLEPGDMLGAIGENVGKVYSFDIPDGIVKKISVRMENYMVLHFDDPLSSWDVYTSDSNGTEKKLIGNCIPHEGGGGYPAPPDCWFISEDQEVLAGLNPGGTSHIRLRSKDVGGDDWMMFNDIEVIVEYEPDENNDQVHAYYIKVDLSGIDTTAEITSARLEFNISQNVANGVGELYIVDNTLELSDSPELFHNPDDPNYQTLMNPFKKFSCEQTGLVRLNIIDAIEDAIDAGQSSIAIQIREQDNDQLFAIYADNHDDGPALVLSQKAMSVSPDEPPVGPPAGEYNSSQILAYDSLAIKNLSILDYTKHDQPSSVTIGSPFAAEFNTGDLEPGDMLGAVGENVYSIYSFEIPDGIVKKISVRMENYMVLHFDDPISSWDVYTSDPNGTEIKLIGNCIPQEGGGGYPAPPDCWFISEDPEVLAGLNPGGTSHIKLLSKDVDGDDWMMFNDIEVIVEYELQPGSNTINRYYIKYDISQFEPATEIDSAVLSLYITQAAPDAAGNVSLVDSSYNTQTGAYSIYNADDVNYSSLINPIKKFSCSTVGTKYINIKPALEDAIAAGESHIAFLISEIDENALFEIEGSTSANAPALDVHLKSGISSGTANWNIIPTSEGQFTLRISAYGSTGIIGKPQDMIISIVDPDKPIINSIDCMVDNVWVDCQDVQYGDILQKIRINSTDPQGDTPDINLRLTNVPDSHNYIDGPVSGTGGNYIYDSNLTINDSGQWQIQVNSSDSQSNTATKIINWNVPWGRLEGTIDTPTGNLTVNKSESFDVSGTIECLNGECSDTKVTLKLNEPFELLYDDGTPEDYGEIGAIGGYLATEITPTEYPAQVKAIRFYIWDETAYPFELNLWDDDGDSGAPGNFLITPFTVNPVVISTDQEVRWFEVDLTEYNIIINEGSFFVGFQQLSENQINQVGFDTNGPRLYRSWGYLDILGLGWFNLNDFCSFDPGFCGNLMIRAIMNTPSSFAGDMPDNPATAPFYTLDEYPFEIGEMKAGDLSEFGFNVKAVGAIGETSSIMPFFSTNYNYGTSESFKVTITPPLTPCHAANLDAFGVVDLKDLSIICDQWLLNSPPLSADINNSGKVDFADFAILATYWLSDCK